MHCFLVHSCLCSRWGPRNWRSSSRNQKEEKRRGAQFERCKCDHMHQFAEGLGWFYEAHSRLGRKGVVTTLIKKSINMSCLGSRCVFSENLLRWREKVGVAFHEKKIKNLTSEKTPITVFKLHLILLIEWYSTDHNCRMLKNRKWVWSLWKTFSF